MTIPETQEDVMLRIGLNYIRFAVENPNLFRFLYQSGLAVENNLLELINSEELIPVISVMQEEMNINIEQTKEILLRLLYLFMDMPVSLLTIHLNMMKNS